MKFSKRRILFVATLVVVTSIGGAFAYHSFQAVDARQAQPGKEARAVVTESDRPQLEAMNHNGSELVVRAFAVEARWGAAGARHSYTGTLQPRYQASVAFRVAGKISERLVEVGQHIQKGQALFRLDPV